MSIFNAYASAGGAIKKATTYRTDATTISFTGLAKEPAWFVCVETSDDGAPTAMICTIIYDGATKRAYQTNDAGRIANVSTNVSFVYSNRSLTMKTTVNYFGYGLFELYYL